MSNKIRTNGPPQLLLVSKKKGFKLFFKMSAKCDRMSLQLVWLRVTFPELTSLHGLSQGSGQICSRMTRLVQIEVKKELIRFHQLLFFLPLSSSSSLRLESVWYFFAWSPQSFTKFYRECPSCEPINRIKSSCVPVNVLSSEQAELLLTKKTQEVAFRKCCVSKNTIRWNF